MPRNNSKARKAARKAVAAMNALLPQVNCMECGTRHRDGRGCAR